MLTDAGPDIEDKIDETPRDDGEDKDKEDKDTPEAKGKNVVKRKIDTLQLLTVLYYK